MGIDGRISEEDELMTEVNDIDWGTKGGVSPVKNQAVIYYLLYLYKLHLEFRLYSLLNSQNLPVMWKLLGIFSCWNIRKFKFNIRNKTISSIQ